jgi:peptidoglycan/xylan/chitin deacetylase (PgdA/CDA1 family)
MLGVVLVAGACIWFFGQFASASRQPVLPMRPQVAQAATSRAVAAAVASLPKETDSATDTTAAETSPTDTVVEPTPAEPGSFVDITYPVPVLMYHVVGREPTPGHLPGLYIPGPDFIAQMDYLASAGYHPVTLQQVYDAWHGTATLPSKPIVLSFDDGSSTDYTFVAPVLRQHNWPAVLFLIVGKDKPHMSTTAVRGLIADGWEIDSHTVSHLNLTTLGDNQLALEVAGSRAALQQRYNIPVNFFCYPSGFFDARVEAAVQSAGYLGATTTRFGVARGTEPYTLSRVRVSRGDSVTYLASILKGMLRKD